MVGFVRNLEYAAEQRERDVRLRNDAIEECARAVDEFFEATGWASKIAEKIRALKTVQ